jgi:hypothetical protein
MDLKLSLFGLDGILKQIRELLRDLWYRNRQEQRKGDLEIERLEEEKNEHIKKTLATTDLRSIWFARLDSADAHRVVQFLIPETQDAPSIEGAGHRWDGSRSLDGNVPGTVGLNGRRAPMRAEEIREAQRAQPFVPFTMHLADGRQFTVIHPDFLWVSKAGRFAIVEDLDGNSEHIDPLLVVSLSIPSRAAETPTG